MKSFKVIIAGAIALLACGFSSVRATTVNWSAAADNGFSDASGTSLASGSLLLIGSFDIPEATIQANSGNVAFLMSHFATFGSSTIGTNVGGLPGYFAQSTVNNSDATTPFADGGKKIFIWAFNTPSTATATQQGIFSLNSSSAWVFPHDNDVVTVTSIDLTDLTGAAPTMLAPGADIVIGGFLQGTGNLLNFNLAVIPEPSSYVLLVTGVVGFLLIRRRAKSRRTA